MEPGAGHRCHHHEVAANLIDRSVAGDGGAFGQLIAPHVEVLRRVAYLHAPKADVDDVLQEALTRAWSQLQSLRTGASLRAWLVAITANTARNRSRGTRRRDKWELVESARATTTAPSAEDQVVDPGVAKEVVAAVEALPRGQREAVAYRYFLDLSEAETADALGIPVGTVKSRVARAMSALRHELGEIDRG